MLTTDKLSRIHESLLADVPKAAHLALYSTYPKHRGFDASELDVPQFEAVFVLGVAQTYPMGAGGFHRVAMVVSKHAEDWAVEQMTKIVKGIFERLRSEHRLDAAKVVGASLDHLLMGSRALQIQEPERWVAFGFQVKDPIPEWLQHGLLGVSSGVDGNT